MATLRLIHCLHLNITLFVLGIVGVVLNRKSVLLTLMSIEVILLSISLNFITGSIFFNDVIGEIFVIFILAVAASESAIGLAIIVSICRHHRPVENILIKKIKTTKQFLPFKNQKKILLTRTLGL